MSLRHVPMAKPPRPPTNAPCTPSPFRGGGCAHVYRCPPACRARSAVTTLSPERMTLPAHSAQTAMPSGTPVGQHAPLRPTTMTPLSAATHACLHAGVRRPVEQRGNAKPVRQARMPHRYGVNGASRYRMRCHGSRRRAPMPQANTPACRRRVRPCHVPSPPGLTLWGREDCP